MTLESMPKNKVSTAGKMEVRGMGLDSYYITET